MDKAQAIDAFWKSFGIKAYDENTVPKDTEFPYITYNVTTAALGTVVNLYGSIWYREPSWKNISLKTEEISRFIGYGGKEFPIDGGYMWLVRGTPFAQRMSDPNDDMIRRMYINIQAEFLTAD